VYDPVDQLYDATAVLNGVVLPSLREIIRSPCTGLQDPRLEGIVLIVEQVAANLDRAFAQSLAESGMSHSAVHHSAAEECIA
ncbi:hypothetical protein, partial [Acetobacter musti]|uniref:hypothetical protein n=1 Tax=Acetobacter musti TaxID=864732 RepID=UPI0038CFFF76